MRYRLLEGTGRVAEIHLTWRAKSEVPPLPRTLLFASFEGWAAKVGDDEEPE